jgi:molecular chaperone DnaK
MLSDKYGSDKILSSEKPMLAIAEGAAILAQSLPSDEDAIEETKAESQIGVVLTTKHQTLIRLENPDGSTHMEKIIDSQEVLPYEANKKFRTVSNNQKIVEVRLFTDAENGSVVKTASGFFTISDNLPAMSELNFTFNLDEDETMTAKVKIVKTGKVTEIRLGRGQNDSSCLSELSQKLEDVIGNSQISDEKKATFIGEMQQIIDTINKNNYTPTDSRWGDHEEAVRSAYTRALMGEKQENHLGQILASILVGNFSRFLNDEDEKEMRDGLFKLKNSTDNFEKESIQQQLENTANQYSLLINVFFFKIVGDNSNNPQTAGRAVCVYDEMVAALDNHNIGEVRELIRSNQDLLEALKSEGINIGMATGLA